MLGVDDDPFAGAGGGPGRAIVEEKCLRPSDRRQLHGNEPDGIGSVYSHSGTSEGLHSAASAIAP